MRFKHAMTAQLALRTSIIIYQLSDIASIEMKTVYVYVAAAAAIAVLVVSIMLWSQTPGTASVEKTTAQYHQSGLNQNPTETVQNTPAHNNDNNKRINENGFGDGDGD